jgi:capsular exopolysaccharide synthesis family protein
MEYLRILRRRWWVLLLATLLGFSVAFATQPNDKVPVTKAPAPIYTAYATLISDPLARQGTAFGVQWDKLSLLITKGDVPQTVERKLGTLRRPPNIGDALAENANGKKKRRGGPRSVAFPFAQVSAQPDPSTGALIISAVSYDRLYAVQMANLFTTELLRYLRNVGVQKYNAQLAGYDSLRTSLQTRLDQLNGQIAAAGAANQDTSALVAEQSAAQHQIESTNQSVFQLKQYGPQQPNLRTLEAASPSRTLMVGGIASPPAITKDQRTLIGAAVGFLLGLAGLLIFEFLNARIRDVSGTEAAARMPLVAEIPALKMSRADRFRVLTAEDPASLMAEAYRSLRTSIVAMWQRHPLAHGAASDDGGHVNPAWRPLRTLLITSPGPAEGKSVSAVNLAATFAETGASVIVIDADFRRPQLDRYFQRPAVPNLGDLGLDMTTKDFEAVLQDTNIPGVRFAASSPPKSSPGAAMAVAKAAVVIAKELADIVVIDSPPLLLANDASDLSTFADATVLLVRAGWTRHKAVAGAADLLRRLEATTVGVVLVGAEHGTHDGYYGYYGYYGYGYGYGRGESVEESLRHRLMPWRRPRPEEPHRSEVGAKAPAPGSEQAESGADTPPRRSDDEPWV